MVKFIEKTGVILNEEWFQDFYTDFNLATLQYYRLDSGNTTFYFSEDIDSEVTAEIDSLVLANQPSYTRPPNQKVSGNITKINGLSSELGEINLNTSSIFDSPNFDGDMLLTDGTDGYFRYSTPNGGTVKLNGVVQSLLLKRDTDFTIRSFNQSEFASFSKFPKTVSNNLPGKDPVNDYDDFIPLLHDPVSGAWFENPVPGQTHYWRVIIDYTKPDNRKNKKVVLTVENPVSGFTQQQVFILADKNEFLNFSLTYDFITVADAVSIAGGYLLKLKAEDQDLTINNLTVTRVSWEDS